MQNYQRVSVLGEGSFGKVYLMRHRVERKLLCVKVIRVKNIPRKEREAVRTEVELLRRLNHPNIVGYRESFLTQSKAQLCIVMTYCDGGDLGEMIKKQAKRGVRFKEARIMHLFVQMALALHYMHENRILHRDLKTQNIFLLGNGRLVLGDLGISKVLEGTADFAQTCIGTPYYMSPEIFKNKPYNHKSDVWALGCVLYELVTLKHAFDAKSLNGLACKIINGSYPPIHHSYSSQLRQLIDAMLSTNPSSRPSMDDLLKRPLLKRHLRGFLSDLVQRAQDAEAGMLAPGSKPLGEGTIAVRDAAIQAAGASGAHAAHSAAGDAQNTKDVATLRKQLESLNMVGVLEQLLGPSPAAAGGGPSSVASGRSAVSSRDRQRAARERRAALQREEERKKQVEGALAKLRSERGRRLEHREQRQAKRAANRRAGHARARGQQYGNAVGANARQPAANVQGRQQQQQRQEEARQRADSALARRKANAMRAQAEFQEQEKAKVKAKAKPSVSSGVAPGAVSGGVKAGAAAAVRDLDRWEQKQALAAQKRKETRQNELEREQDRQRARRERLEQRTRQAEAAEAEAQAKVAAERQRREREREARAAREAELELERERVREARAAEVARETRERQQKEHEMQLQHEREVRARARQHKEQQLLAQQRELERQIEMDREKQRQQQQERVKREAQRKREERERAAAEAEIALEVQRERERAVEQQRKADRKRRQEQEFGGAYPTTDSSGRGSSRQSGGGGNARGPLTKDPFASHQPLATSESMAPSVPRAPPSPAAVSPPASARSELAPSESARDRVLRRKEERRIAEEAQTKMAFEQARADQRRAHNVAARQQRAMFRSSIGSVDGQYREGYSEADFGQPDDRANLGAESDAEDRAGGSAQQYAFISPATSPTASADNSPLPLRHRSSDEEMKSDTAYANREQAAASDTDAEIDWASRAPLSPPPGVDSGAAREHREEKRARAYDMSFEEHRQAEGVGGAAFEQDYDSGDDEGDGWSGDESADSDDSIEADEDMQRAEDELEQQLHQTSVRCQQLRQTLGRDCASGREHSEFAECDPSRGGPGLCKSKETWSHAAQEGKESSVDEMKDPHAGEEPEYSFYEDDDDEYDDDEYDDDEYEEDCGGDEGRFSASGDTYAGLQDPPSPHTGRLSDRISILRRRCVEKLGDDAFLRAYEFLKRKDEHEMRDTDEEDEFLSRNLQKILGAEDLAWAWGLIDQLIFMEDAMR